MKRTIPIMGETRIDHGEPRLSPEDQAAELRRQLAERKKRPQPRPGALRAERP